MVATIALGAIPPAHAGNMHASAWLCGAYSSTVGVKHSGVAHVEIHKCGKYRVAHEEAGYNYTTGTGGSGHAHHHSGSDSAAVQVGRSEGREDAPRPTPGAPGTAQFAAQTWEASADGNGVIVTWSPEFFLQVDPSEVAARPEPGTDPDVDRTPGRVVSRAGISSPSTLLSLPGTPATPARLAGEIVLTAVLSPSGGADVRATLTGVFAGVRYELVPHPTGVVSLHLLEPQAWTVAATLNSFEIELYAGNSDASPGAVADAAALP